MFGLDFIDLPLAGTPFGTALEVCLVLAFVAWLLSVITREVSWIDRLWSICPPVYCLIVAFATDFQWARVNVMTLLVVLWGARLTWNFARKGGCYSRHPNYFCELGMWWVFYLFAVAASGEWVHWTGLGCIGLTLLFIPSLRMTEQLSVAKYPAYRDYQATTSVLIPLPPRGR